MEQISDKVKYDERVLALTAQLWEEGWTDIQNYLAEQIELAYIAGENSYIAGRQCEDIRDTGEVKVAAVNYTKFKGYKL